MYDYAPVGLALAAIGFVFLAFAYRILPKDRAPAVNLEEALAANAYLTEVEAPGDWPLAGLRIGALHDLAGGEADMDDVGRWLEDGIAPSHACAI